MKNFAMWSRGVMVLAGVLLLCGQSAGATEVPYIEARGESILSVAPDLAFLTIAVVARNADPRAAQATVASASEDVFRALGAAKLAPDALRTLSYSVQEEFEWQERKRKLLGYVARNMIEVRVDDVQRVGDVLALAVAQGATAVSGLRFDVRNRKELEQKALREAVSRARAFAEAAAAGAGVSLGEILKVEQEGGFSPAPRALYAHSRVADRKAAAPPIEAGTIEVRATARIRASIEPLP